MNGAEALQIGWNDAVEGKPFDEAMSFHRFSMVYERGRHYAVELRAAAKNGGEAPRPWLGDPTILPAQVWEAARLYRSTPNTQSDATLVEQEILHRGQTAARVEVLLPKRKRRVSVRRRLPVSHR